VRQRVDVLAPKSSGLHRRIFKLPLAGQRMRREDGNAQAAFIPAPE
jgi:hypothetical protein